MNGKKSGGIGIIGVIIAIIVLLAIIGSCGKSNDSYKETLNNGLEKYYNGDPMTKEEHDAVQNFNEWKNNQGEKTYDKW